MKIFTLILIASLSLTACTTLNQSSSWPESMPPKSYFIDYYALDTEHQKILSLDGYLAWVKRFYLGWKLYKRGWLQVADEVSLTVNDLDKEKIKDKVLQIGKLVSPEWAKNQDYRVINTKHLGIWGNTLNESIVRKEQELMLDRIHADVIALIGGDLTPKDITEERYYKIEVFGGNFENFE